MLKAIFVSTTHQAGIYWAKQWGFKKQEVKIVTNYHDAMGYNTTLPVYMCGPYNENSRMILEICEYFKSRGNVVMDAQEMGGEARNPLGL